MRFKTVGYLFLLIFMSVKHVSAENQFITIVNPIRISDYNQDLSQSIRSQYYEVAKRNLPATWLFTYDSLQDAKVITHVTKFDAKQELGLFLEVSPNFAKLAGVNYQHLGSWHFAGSVFLSGYTQLDRQKLIDLHFSKFRDLFGKYPSTVGSWWTDSFSLNYMKNKYGITANVSCADQFSTDGYQIWGTYWSTPYYPSISHTGIPANSLANKLDIVNLQWAARHPAEGYYDSTFSTQDYFTSPKKDIRYFKDLLNLYAKSNSNQFGQITIGLEGDFSPSAYQGEYALQLDTAITEASLNNYQLTTVSAFSTWYRNRFPGVSPVHAITSQTTWYNSPFYRLGYALDPPTLFDLRIYSDRVHEPYYVSPNASKFLEINIPSVIDSFSNPSEAWTLPSDATIKPLENRLVITTSEHLSIPKYLKSHPGISVSKNLKQTSLTFSSTPISTGNGETILGWKNFSKVNYFVSQDELTALYKLSLLPPGTVLTPDHECLQCDWHTELQPAAYANDRTYVSTFAKKRLVKNQKVFSVTNRQESLAEFIKTQSKYIYLVKLEGLQEKLPFSPGDLGVVLVYSNANAEVWRTKSL